MKRAILLALFAMAMNAHASFRGLNASGLDIGGFNKVKCSTGMTCTKVGGAFNMVSSPNLVGPLTLEDGEILRNTPDDTVEVISNDNHTTFQITGFEAKNAVLNLWADEGDDNADKYSLTSDASTNSLTFKNHTTSLLSFGSTGVITLADAETITNASDVITFGFDDAAGEVRINAFEATDAKLTLQADESDDNGDDWQIASVASGNTFTISNDTSGTQAAKFTMTTAGNISLVGTLTGDGGDALSGFLQKRVLATATTITAAQCGSTFYNGGAVQIELPEASTVLGCRLTFITANASNFDVNPDNADIILILTNAAGDMIRNATLGNTVTLEALSASEWVVVGEKGTWADAD